MAASPWWRALTFFAFCPTSDLADGNADIASKITMSHEQINSRSRNIVKVKLALTRQKGNGQGRSHGLGNSLTAMTRRLGRQREWVIFKAVTAQWLKGDAFQPEGIGSVLTTENREEFQTKVGLVNSPRAS
ncbi:hypothetical protein EVAR_22884_1 [Eumeta japonica]|uniref:Uncharacterized protein n=1 Tax=Eumeta variegata TaxID=151549 RepID=A0A4C1UW09_EUMVA|nr:hypothetical protein EVAR_22884_1 [Eumeta japonica]